MTGISTKGKDVIASHQIPPAFLSFAVILAFASTAWPLSLKTTALPRDIHEAEMMLREGSLDSIEWEVLQPYYVQPISVPAGELSLLYDVFDLRIENLPLSDERLAAYRPWDGAARENFFRDYPELAKYAPILSFSRGDGRRRSTAGLALSVDDDLQTSARSRFTVRCAPGVSISGGMSHADTAVLWVRRGVSVSVPGIGAVEAGNFTLASADGLFYGYFPDAPSQPVTTLANWEYGGSHAWNGLYAESDFWRGAKFSGFFHQRPTERVFGVFCEADPWKTVKLTAGVSRLDGGPSDSGWFAGGYTVHYGIAGAAGGFRYSVRAGTSSGSPLAVPVSAQCESRTHGASFSLMLARLPAGCALARSRIAFDCRNELDMDDGAQASDISLADCRTTLALSDAFATSASLSYVTSGARAALSAGAGASGKWLVDYRLTYDYRMSTAADEETHRVGLLLTRAVSRIVKPELACGLYFRDDGFGSVTARLPVAVSVPGGMNFSPYAAVYASTSRQRSYTAGLRQELRITPEMWCDCDASMSVDENKQREWNVDARAYFCF
jgi:hypothetical protein